MVKAFVNKAPKKIQCWCYSEVSLPWTGLHMTCVQLRIDLEIQRCKVCSHDAQVAHLASMHL